ncbi:Oidioi.mRNA.OKI2018_I69.chr1.g2297.t1.cds [Oikopleura dioica]|uniref:Oidioi.mRNA.OKI2018_I69.chr1.g2297.t1.cds n=1 Tax=Oikopleura dioica TaxID=34765 RepID=A0ABN7SUL4_OIKDI|nr:Oidioi.mRNA.OKI2018_I69.chr1.g2297.t1.cds [Oikopleura dioica]
MYTPAKDSQTTKVVDVQKFNEIGRQIQDELAYLKRSTQRSTYQFLKKTDSSINPYEPKKVKTVIFSGRKKKLRPKTSYRSLSPAPSISLLLPPYLIESTNSFASSGSTTSISSKLSFGQNF